MTALEKEKLLAVKGKIKEDLFMKLFTMGKNIGLQLRLVRMVSLLAPILFQLNKGV